MTNKEDLKNMTGQTGRERFPSYKLNEVTMSGDDGSFRLKEILGPKNTEGKYNVEQLGQELHGVILKMRWRLSRYEEEGQSLATTEYDNKHQDEVVVFPMKDRGNAATMKERYKLSTQRVVYLYVPAKQQIVRLIVKASGLSGDKNPKEEKGLFEHIDEFNETNTLAHEFVTTCKGVFREGQNTDGSRNKRKDHYAMSFSTGRKLNESELAKVEGMIRDVHEKTAPATAPTHEDVLEEQEEASPSGIEYPKDEINPDDIPF
jgi:hypothetical protein